MTGRDEDGGGRVGEGKRRAEERGYRKPQVCAVWWVGGMKRGQWKSE